MRRMIYIWLLAIKNWIAKILSANTILTLSKSVFEYIAETGLDPVTGKEVDEELLNYATNYTKYAPSIKAGYDFLMVGTAAWSTRAYNKDIQTQRADAQINEYYQIKDAVRNSSVGSQPVVGPQLPSKELDSGIAVDEQYSI